MKKNTIWVAIVVVVLVILGIILLNAPEAEAPKNGETETEEGEEALPEGEEALSEEEQKEEVGEEVVPGGSKVSDEGKVVADSGEEADNTALPGSPSAPKQSRSLTEEEVPNEAVKLEVSAAGFSPNEFTVNAGEVVVLAITSTDKTHVFKFDDESLKAVAVGVAGGETRAITFNAPVAGDYTFFCDVPGHRGRGETGVMHVK